MTESEPRSEPVAGLVLAAGAGRRIGRAKALLRTADGTPWTSRAAEVLRAAGCTPVHVVLGADLESAADLLRGEPVTVVPASDWQEGMGASLRAGLRSLAALPGGDAGPSAALVMLVDLPGVTTAAVRRLLQAGGDAPDGLRRAAYQGVPGHPVLIGREHWAAVIAAAGGDRGARDYLDAHRATLVECGDLAAGRDVDSRADLLPGDLRER